MDLEESTVPEIKRCNLSSVVLQMKAMGIEDILDFPFLDSPPLESSKLTFNFIYQLIVIFILQIKK